MSKGNYRHNHVNRSPFPTIWVNVLTYIVASVDPKLPPVCGTDSDLASGPEKQWNICEEGHKHGNPNPYILASELLCSVVIANPAPIL